jgi:hypothetical protein
MEWSFESQDAADQAENIQLQIDAATTRRDLAQRDLDAFDRAAEQAQALDEFYRQRFTSEDLYGWLLTQVSSLYFQTYQLAYDQARRAEEACRSELGLYGGDARFVRAGQWDSLRGGLLAADQLRLDLMRLESSYNQQRGHRLEIVKRVSLDKRRSPNDPAPPPLTTLLTEGVAFISIGEDVYDADYIDHYQRRMVTVDVGVTFAPLPSGAPPRPTGPPELHCTLTLTRDLVRTQPGRSADPYVSNDKLRTLVSGTLQSRDGDDALYSTLFVADPTTDERLFPFEGAGAISEWRISLPPANSSALGVIDVWLVIKYTALAPDPSTGTPVALSP